MARRVARYCCGAALVLSAGACSDGSGGQGAPIVLGPEGNDLNAYATGDAGTVRRIRFAGDAPQPPETMDSGLRLPDAVGIFTP